VVERRAFLAVAGTALAGGVLSACGSGGNDDSNGIATATGAEQSTAGSADVAILNQALMVEQRSVAAYQAAATRLSGARRSTAQDFEAQERQHVEALSKAVTALGATPTTARDRYALPALRDPAAVLRFAMGVEQIAIAQYLDLIPKLSSQNLRGTFASILTVEAQHLAVLREEAGQQPVPDAFVGSRPT
jgi:rubrerythrin